ncbi:MAG: hypothetical protein MUC38_05765 [Cyclobacteriaceae bacterium]|jgi:uncharacterized tellurite resistance protein B-like protein|nr:hypothetical protein [Cyclobacteriaceae bacterium]
MDIVTKKQLNVLIQLAEADKHFAKVERDFILKLAQDRQYPQDQVLALIRNPEPIDGLGALSNDQKFDYLMTCLELVFADQKVFESELIFCRSIAIKLGFRKHIIDFLVENFQTRSREELKKTAFADYL